MATMLAGRLELDPRKFVLREVPVPEPGPGEVRVRVKAAGVCLSDVHLIDGSLTPLFLQVPEVTLGHEVAGVVDALGPDVPGGWQEGDRVALLAGERCGRCANCIRFQAPCLQGRTRGVDYDGGWAEYAIASQHTLVALPDDLPFDQASIVPDAVSTPWGAITGTAQVRPGQSAGVWGAGGLGAHAVQLLRLVGAAPIIAVDPLAAARERALEFGADAAFDASAPDLVQQVFAATGGRGLDVAFDMAGVAAVREQAVKCLGFGGKLVLAGLTPAPLTVPDSIGLSFLHKQVLGHYGSAPGDVETLVDLARHHRLDWSRSISDHLPLAEAATAVDRLTRKEGNPIRLILEP
ncbi:D-arabinose 1-dehydrogenase-like Zn-dependent alcohol dehydrogenase [Amycolatopsis bartoniae]|uniref:Alcohol dehydrogenase n=1 Tax=Amycolatopsis bartoniae TaxID=941986 RepID=A0A8H9MBB9_9PSEU|nr:zinc-binding dehydrogenase [Amycolatopsis bartoniae]MBB2938329.1 D-arabinose 1-dehydrogenase-like Zn-dependent alcohol dehydrogenase [Amycolatopsis bartoniae]TVT01793.1 zinc-binding dehydrogenase [Amycolatopsis bartoniae]GHF34376.1 alcohol dehydrogenase [Amycolatopsis bartoniae]